jgi:hypothetical protein
LVALSESAASRARPDRRERRAPRQSRDGARAGPRQERVRTGHRHHGSPCWPPGWREARPRWFRDLGSSACAWRKWVSSVMIASGLRDTTAPPNRPACSAPNRKSCLCLPCIGKNCGLIEGEERRRGEARRGSKFMRSRGRDVSSGTIVVEHGAGAQQVGPVFGRISLVEHCLENGVGVGLRTIGAQGFAIVDPGVNDNP